jgi:hypothetical protein
MLLCAKADVPYYCPNLDANQAALYARIQGGRIHFRGRSFAQGDEKSSARGRPIRSMRRTTAAGRRREPCSNSALALRTESAY